MRRKIIKICDELIDIDNKIIYFIYFKIKYILK